MNEEITEKGEAIKEVEKLNVLGVSAIESNLKKALDKLFGNTFGNQANKKIYLLQKELIPYVKEYSHLRNKIGEDPKNVKGGMLNDSGMKDLLSLNQTYGDKDIEVECELPIKLLFLDCFSSNDRIVLEAFGIVEFQD